MRRLPTFLVGLVMVCGLTVPSMTSGPASAEGPTSTQAPSATSRPSSTTVPTSTSTTGAGHTTTAPTTTATTATTEPVATTTGVPATTTTEPQVSLTPPAPQSHSGTETPTKPSGGGSALAGGCPETRPSYESACGPPYTLPQWSDLSGWEQPSSYQTIQLAKVEDGPGEELIGRSPVGLWVEKFDSTTGQWELQGTPQGGVALPLSNATGWNRPQYYGTIQFADVTGQGQEYLLARSATGLQTWRWDAGTDTFEAAGPTLTTLSDSADWSGPQYYSTIQTADVAGTGQRFLLARGTGGLFTFPWGANGWTQAGPVLAALSNSSCGQPACYKTIQTGDVTGDGKADLLARTSDGLRAYEWGPSGWTQVGGLLPLDDAHGWNQPQSYETIQTAHVDGTHRVDVIGSDSSGLHTYQWGPTGWREVGPVLADLSDQSGYGQAQFYKTIRTADVNGDGKDVLMARNSKGVAVYEWSGHRWSQLTADAVSLADPLWANPAYYETIQAGDIEGNGRSDLVARGTFGIRTFVWNPSSRAFIRPMPYGRFPPFTGDEGTAYAALGQFLLGHPAADFREATYASPNNSITEAALDRYRGLLSERCQPAPSVQGLAPPRYRDCVPPPSSNVSPDAWTAVSNRIIAELWAAPGTVSYFSTLESIETTLFQEQGATFPAIDAAFKLPPNPPDRSATYLKLIKSGLEIAGDILQLLPGVNLPARLIRTVALTAHAFGAVGEGLGLANSPSAPESYAQITDQLAKIQQRERDISEAQRRYVLGDYGLLMTVGTLTNGRLLTLDSTAMRSIGRQTFAQWVYELYLPAYARRYDVTNCRYDIKGVYCDIPNGSLVRAAPGGKFTGVFWMNSDCTRHLGNTEKRCTWHQVPPGIAQQLVSPISKDCQYDGAPGSTAVWRYGCGLGKWLVCHPEMKKSPPKGRRFHLGRRGVRWNGARRAEIRSTTTPSGFAPDGLREEAARRGASRSVGR